MEHRLFAEPLPLGSSLLNAVNSVAYFSPITALKHAPSTLLFSRLRGPLADASFLTFSGGEGCTPAPPTSVSQPMETSASSSGFSDRPEAGRGARGGGASCGCFSSTTAILRAPFYVEARETEFAKGAEMLLLTGCPCDLSPPPWQPSKGSTSWETPDDSLKGPLEAFPLHCLLS